MVRVEIPYMQGNLISLLHDGANVLKEEYNERGILIEAMVDDQVASRLALKLGSEALEWLD